MRAASITDYIPIGKENAVTRAHLRAVTGLPDRKIREEIEQARRKGAIIINAQDALATIKARIYGILRSSTGKTSAAPFRSCTAKAFTQAVEGSWRNGRKESGYQ